MDIMHQQYLTALIDKKNTLAKFYANRLYKHYYNLFVTALNYENYDVATFIYINAPDYERINDYIKYILPDNKYKKFMKLLNFKLDKYSRKKN